MADAPTRPLELLQFRVSHYNEKARWALDRKRVPHVRTTLVPGLHMRRVRKLTGQAQTPVLVLEDGRALADSSAILAELDRRVPDPPLYPADPAARARVEAIEAFFDDEVAPDLRRLFWACYLDRSADMARMATDGAGRGTRILWRAMLPVARPLLRRNMGIDPERLALARERLPGYLDRLASEIGPSGFLVGDAFTAADLTAAAVMTAVLRPPEFSYPLPEPWPPALTELRDRIADHPASRWVFETYQRHRGPSAELPRAG